MNLKKFKYEAKKDLKHFKEMLRFCYRDNKPIEFYNYIIAFSENRIKDLNKNK